MLPQSTQSSAWRRHDVCELYRKSPQMRILLSHTKASSPVPFTEISYAFDSSVWWYCWAQQLKFHIPGIATASAKTTEVLSIVERSSVYLRCTFNRIDSSLLSCLHVFRDSSRKALEFCRMMENSLHVGQEQERWESPVSVSSVSSWEMIND